MIDNSEDLPKFINKVQKGLEKPEEDLQEKEIKIVEIWNP